MRTLADARREAVHYRRLGGLVMGPRSMDRYEPDARMSRAIQVARTWRSHFAWHLANALGWRVRLP